MHIFWLAYKYCGGTFKPKNIYAGWIVCIYLAGTYKSTCSRFGIIFSIILAASKENLRKGKTYQKLKYMFSTCTISGVLRVRQQLIVLEDFQICIFDVVCVADLWTKKLFSNELIIFLIWKLYKICDKTPLINTHQKIYEPLGFYFDSNQIPTHGCRTKRFAK